MLLSTGHSVGNLEPQDGGTWTLRFNLNSQKLEQSPRPEAAKVLQPPPYLGFWDWEKGSGLTQGREAENLCPEFFVFRVAGGSKHVGKRLSPIVSRVRV